MPDCLRGTEQEHIRALFNSIQYGMRPRCEQAKEIAVVVRIKTIIGGACQNLAKISTSASGALSNIEQMYQTTSGLVETS